MFDGDVMATLVAPIQILAGDQHGLNTLEHQPTKIMAMEGHFESHKDGALLILFGWPNEKAARRNMRSRCRNWDRDPQAFLDAPLAVSTPCRAKTAAGADHVLGVPHHGRPRFRSWGSAC